MFDILGGIAGSIIGGLFGDERDEDSRTLAREQTASSQAFSDKQFAEQMAFQREQLGTNTAWAREQQARNEQLQREFASHGIQWKMEDAAAAGLHPVYGAGLGGAAFASNPVVVNPVVSPSAGGASVVPPSYSRSHMDYASMGQGLGRLIEKLLVKDTVKDAALAAAVDSNAAVTTQAANSMGIVTPGAFTPGSEMEWPQRVFVPPTTISALDTRTYKPDENTSVLSSDPSTTAGVGKAGWSNYNLGGLHMDVPSKELSEPLESISESVFVMAATITHNVNKYGMGWLRQFSEKFIPGYGPAINAMTDAMMHVDVMTRQKIQEVLGIPRRVRPTQRTQGVIRPPSGW